MKKWILFFVLTIGASSYSKAQVDVQINPIAILFEGLQLSAEFVASEYVGVELDLIAGGGSVGLVGLGKYYFRPEYGADKFYIGAFAGGISDFGGGFGFITGYKILSAGGVSCELGFGIGRSLGGDDLDEVFPYGKLTVGYRFGQNKKD